MFVVGAGAVKCMNVFNFMFVVKFYVLNVCSRLELFRNMNLKEACWGRL